MTCHERRFPSDQCRCACNWQALRSNRRKRKRDMSVVNEIVRYVIHPGIGIARVGNSPDEYFIGSRSSGPGPTTRKWLQGPLRSDKNDRQLDFGFMASMQQAMPSAKSQRSRRRSHGGSTSPTAKPLGTNSRTAMDLGAKYAKTAALRNKTITGAESIKTHHRSRASH